MKIMVFSKIYSNKKSQGPIQIVVTFFFLLLMFSVFSGLFLREDYKTKYDNCELEKSSFQQSFELQKNQTIICNEHLQNISSELNYYKTITNITEPNIIIQEDYWQNVYIHFTLISIFFIVYFIFGLGFKLFDINIELEIENKLEVYISEKWAKVIARLIKILIVLILVFIGVLLLNLI